MDPGHEPLDQHYVPQMLLRPFGHGRKREWLWRYDKQFKRILKGSVRKSAASPHFYETVKIGASGGNDIEGLLARLESAAAPSLEWLRYLAPGKHEFPAMARFHAAVFLAVQHARVPATRDRAEAAARLERAIDIHRLLADPVAFANQAIRSKLQERDKRPLEEIRRDLLAAWSAGDLQAIPPKGLVQLELLKLAMDSLGEQFFEMDWSIAIRSRIPWLVIGDAPVSPIIPAGLPWHAERGFVTPGASVAVPLAPDRLLVLRGRRRTPDISVLDADAIPDPASLDPDWVYAPNQATWRRAERFIYGRSRADLEATLLSLDPEERDSVRKTRIVNLPDEWKIYARDEFEIVPPQTQG